MKQWVDVPGGWAYGWPKLYDPEKDGDFKEWIRSAGYKGSLEDVSGWYQEEEKVMTREERRALLLRHNKIINKA